MTTKQVVHKPVIETIINTAALTLTASGVVMASNRDVFGIVLIAFGALLEFFKYWGRKNNYW